MHFSASTLAALALSVSTSAASSILFKNYCNEDIFAAINNTLPPITVPSGQAFTSDIVGQGNTAVVTKNIASFNSETAKMVLGSSTDQGVLYWSLSSQDGDPFVDQRFNVTSSGSDATGVVVPNLCGNTTSYDGWVHACQDSGAVTLTLFACPFNAAL